MAALAEQATTTALRPASAGRNPWALAWRRLRTNRIALAALGLLILIILVCLGAPLYARYVAHIHNWNQPNLTGKVVIGGKTVPIMQQGGGLLKLGETPIGPTWHLSNYFLGADSIGRDVTTLILYGGRSSLQIGVFSAVICCIIATFFALIAGYFGGLIDAILSRIMDIVWAFPVLLFAICLATELLTLPNGLKIGLVTIQASSLWVPTLIIAGIYVPYVYRPVRGQVLSVVNREYVEAAVAVGASNARIIFSDILPNVVSTVIVLLPLMTATNILTESALSYLSVGVQPPNVSWGTIINDGQDLLYTRPWVSLAPGIMIVLTVLALNVLGDGVRDALDPRAKLRVR